MYNTIIAPLYVLGMLRKVILHLDASRARTNPKVFDRSVLQ
jgi:hypothetical protein